MMPSCHVTINGKAVVRNIVMFWKRGVVQYESSFCKIIIEDIEGPYNHLIGSYCILSTQKNNSLIVK